MKKLMKDIAYLGIPGSNSFVAAGLFFGRNRFVPVPTIRDIFRAVFERKCASGIVPVENSTTGSIMETFDELVQNNLRITGEIVLKIHHHLLGRTKNIDLDEIRHCYSHPQAIGQCRRIIREMTKARIEFTTDTASAAKLVSGQDDPFSVAVGNRASAGLYDLKIIRENIADSPFNSTRFFIIGGKEPVNANKATLLLSLKHRPGSLSGILHIFAKWEFNLTKIESRPVPGKPWEYLFIIDFIFNHRGILKKAVQEISGIVNQIQILGIYEKGVTYEA